MAFIYLMNNYLFYFIVGRWYLVHRFWKCRSSSDKRPQNFGKYLFLKLVLAPSVTCNCGFYLKLIFYTLLKITNIFGYFLNDGGSTFFFTCPRGVIHFFTCPRGGSNIFGISPTNSFSFYCYAPYHCTCTWSFKVITKANFHFDAGTLFQWHRLTMG